MNPTITIVVPVYNVESYLEQCIESLLHQTFKNFELILVDDGSTDSSLIIEQRYAKFDSRIKVVEKTHSNAGEARNIGLEQARGKYITFLDSDDFYDYTLLEKEYLQIEKHNADICACNGDQYNEKTKKFEPVSYFLVDKYNLDKLHFNIGDCPDYIFQIIATGPWLRMYRLDFIKEHNLNYQSVVRGNDVLFSNMAQALAEKITVVNEVLVHHRVGLTHNLQSGLFDTPDIYLDIELNWKNELEKRGLFEKCRRSFGLYVLNNLRAHYSVGDEKVKRTLEKRIKEGILGKLNFIDYIKEKSREYVTNPEQCSVWEETGYIEITQMMLSIDFPEKNADLIDSIKNMNKNIEMINAGGDDFGVDALFPFEFISRGSRVLIYGLGKVGRGYIKQIKTSHWCKIVGVSDKNADNNVYAYPFYKLEEISKLLEVDKIIIAICDQDTASVVENEMRMLGVAKRKIFRMGSKR